MKKTTSFLAFCFAATMSHAAGNFPMNYSNIFAASAINGSVLELATSQTPNTWSQGEFSKRNSIASPMVEDNTLNFTTYIDNNKGKAILLNSTSSTYTNAYTGNSAFTLTYSTTDFTEGTYYISFLLNVTNAQNVNANTATLVGFDKFLNGAAPRGRVSIMPSTTSPTTEYKLFPGTSGALIETAAVTGLKYGTTYLVVLKYYLITPSATNAECEVSLFVDPTIGVAEPATTKKIVATASSNITNADCIRSFTVYQQPGLTAKIGGVRISSYWSDVVKTDTISSVKNIFQDNLNLLYSKGLISADLSDLTGNVNAKIYSTNGQLIASKELTGGGLVSFNQNFPAGLYLISVESPGVSKSAKLLIK